MNEETELIEALERQQTGRAKLGGSVTTGGTLTVFAVLALVVWWRMRK